jgi:hypothetical protein
LFPFLRYCAVYGTVLLPLLRCCTIYGTVLLPLLRYSTVYGTVFGCRIRVYSLHYQIVLTFRVPNAASMMKGQICTLESRTEENRDSNRFVNDNSYKVVQVGARFSPPVQTNPGAHPASYTMGAESPVGKAAGAWR